jgi:hypothetical protein
MSASSRVGTRRATTMEDEVAAAHQIGSRRLVLMAGVFVVTRHAGVSTILTEAMRPAIVHLDGAIDTDRVRRGRNSNGSSSSDRDKRRRGLNSSMGTMISGATKLGSVPGQLF